MTQRLDEIPKVVQFCTDSIDKISFKQICHELYSLCNRGMKRTAPCMEISLLVNNPYFAILTSINMYTFINFTLNRISNNISKADISVVQ